MGRNRVAAAIERLPTGVAGLDAILCGGLFAAGLYILRGPPGTGKTTLANQIAFTQAAAGRRGAYVTLLSEAHSRMLQHLAAYSFFDESAIPDRLTFLSGYKALDEDGPHGLTRLIRQEIQSRQARFLVLDGFGALEEAAQSDQGLRRFLHELQSSAISLDCTILLVTTGDRPRSSPEYTMADGVLELSHESFVARSERMIGVLKLRGSDFLRGRHFYRITSDGLVIYPRLEALYSEPSRQAGAGPTGMPRGRRLSGSPVLDGMLHGGFPDGSATLLLGASGAGKSSLALLFLAQATEAERSVLVSFREPPAMLVRRAAFMGLDLAAKLSAGTVEILWQPPLEQMLDDIGHRLFAALRGRGVARLVVDGLDDFRQAALLPERLPGFVTALVNEVRTLGVTALYTAELHDHTGGEVGTPAADWSNIADNLLLLRYDERGTSRLRIMSILKMRESGFDPASRAFIFGECGPEFEAALPEARAGPSARQRRTGTRARKNPP